MTQRLLAYDDLKPKGVPYSKVQLWRLEKQKRFPQRIRLGGGARHAWSEREIDDWIASLIAERDSAYAA